MLFASYAEQGSAGIQNNIYHFLLRNVLKSIRFLKDASHFLAKCLTRLANILTLYGEPRLFQFLKTRLSCLVKLSADNATIPNNSSKTWQYPSLCNTQTTTFWGSVWLDSRACTSIYASLAFPRISRPDFKASRVSLVLVTYLMTNSCILRPVQHWSVQIGLHAKTRCFRNWSNIWIDIRKRAASSYAFQRHTSL